MILNHEQLEWIVQEVVRRLAGDLSAARTASSSELIVQQKLVTTHTLADRLDGVALVRVPRRAVVTPAAKDLLRDRGIELASAT